MDTTVRTVIENVDKLLNNLPHGCGEQTMIGLAPVVYGMRYLVNTQQPHGNMMRRGQRMIQIGNQNNLNGIIIHLF